MSRDTDDNENMHESMVHRWSSGNTYLHMRSYKLTLITCSSATFTTCIIQFNTLLLIINITYSTQ